ncbi:Sua5/YciO/YrdC/YwlC family tRNA threonylcarbamoyl adenosine modification protein [Phialophora macrospora]|uniref:Threonylcarbamoyl-AMP synthase n=1 Tax=Phialophora macrospora TaxID=1851006 RepID=A0A0D2F4I8_9EURO|nr:Sua5/YciO/YrdC/YwlC family tRNA threonylcarbamoyl adenosine modification protein [Phialophora macrospora]
MFTRASLARLLLVGSKSRVASTVPRNFSCVSTRTNTGSHHPSSLNTMATTVKGVINDRLHLSSLPYSGCDTRIVSLLDVNIPDQATEEEYRTIYAQYTQGSSPTDRASNASLLRDAIESLRYGIAPPVAFPTETVYGLGADATNEPAVSGIFAAKGRPSDNPLIVHVASVAHLERITGVPLPEVYRAVAGRFWPGPLTILLSVPAAGIFAKNVHPAQNTIGFRIPSSKYARFFIAAADRPIAGPSANSSGKPSPTTAEHVLHDLTGKINFILDGGGCDVGVESTVVDGLHDPPLILRPGGVGLEEFRALGREIGGEVGDKWARTTIGYKTSTHHAIETAESTNGSLPVSSVSGAATPSEVLLSKHMNGNGSGIASYEEDINGAPRAPGMKYRHYAPKGRLILFSTRACQAGRVQEKWNQLVGVDNQRFVKVGIISCHWPPFAGLKDIISSTIDPTRVSEISAPNAAGQKNTDPITHSGFADITSIAQLRVRDIDVVLYNVQLGPEISTLAHSLFGVLRFFDELECSYIFAETVQRMTSPSSGGQSPASDVASGKEATGGAKDQSGSRTLRRDLEDAVIDRIEKAAAERIDE